MEKVLGQREIDALFAAAVTQQAGAAPVRAYRFSFTGHTSNEQMRAIFAVNHLFARNLMQTVSAWLGTEFQVTLVAGEQLAFSEFVERVSESTYVSSVRLEPQGVLGLVGVELTLASPMVELLLGGTGRPETPRPLTDIENLIMTSVMQVIVKELNLAWRPMGLHYGFDKQESAARVARMMPAAEKTVCVCFEVTMPGVMGMLTLCLPAVALNTILTKVIAQDTRTSPRVPEVRERVQELVGESTVGAMLQFPPVRLKARELAALGPGTMLRLPLPRHAAAEFRVAGLALGRARPVRVGEHRGAKMETPGPVEETTRRDGAMRI